MSTREYEDFDTVAWPDAGPIKTSFSGTAARFGDLLVAYDALEKDEWDFDYARFSVPTGEDNTVEDFYGDPANAGGRFEPWEDEWVISPWGYPDLQPKMDWTLIGTEDFSSW